MIRNKWNRLSRKNLSQEKDKLVGKDSNFEIVRIRPKKRKKRHPGYTVLPEHRLWIFEKSNDR